MNRLRRQSGFTLIEVLVALLILGIGLLGLTGLQAHSLRNNYNAYLRTQATFNVYEIIDRMRANRTYALTGGYDTAFTSSATGGDCSAGCSAVEMKNADLNQWLSMVSRLPGGEGSIAVNAGEAVVTVRWYDRRDGDDTNYLEFAARSQL